MRTVNHLCVLIGMRCAELVECEGVGMQIGMYCAIASTLRPTASRRYPSATRVRICALAMPRKAREQLRELSNYAELAYETDIAEFRNFESECRPREMY